METKKLMNKKGATIRDTMIVIVMFVAMFGLFFMFISNNASDSNITIDTEYNDTYNSLTETQDQVSSVRDDLAGAARNLTEAKIGDFAFFGLRGVLKIMTLPLNLLSVASNGYEMVSSEMPIPTELQVAIGLIITIMILFAIIKFITSRGTEA